MSKGRGREGLASLPLEFEEQLMVLTEKFKAKY